MQKTIFLSFFLVLSFLAQAQTKVKGSVFDAKTGETLVQAYIQVENTKLGTATDINGGFESFCRSQKTLFSAFRLPKNYWKK
jgi:hypothetical protein